MIAQPSDVAVLQHVQREPASAARAVLDVEIRIPIAQLLEDILQALVALGYSEREAAAALKALPPDVGVADGIRLALKALSR